MKELQYMPERWCSTKEMCVYLGVNRDTLLTWINEKYIKTKFARALLGVKKVTQHNPKATCEYVPTQDFSAASDIDWSKTISKIDPQEMSLKNATVIKCESCGKEVFSYRKKPRRFCSRACAAEGRKKNA